MSRRREKVTAQQQRIRDVATSLLAEAKERTSKMPDVEVVILVRDGQRSSLAALMKDVTTWDDISVALKATAEETRVQQRSPQ